MVAFQPMEQPRQNPRKEHRLIERLSKGEYEIVRQVLASKTLSEDLSLAWANMATDRLVLAQNHLAVANSIAEECRRGNWDPAGRSVISRAYYSMFCAVRAAVALEKYGDVNDHLKLPDVLRKTTALGPTDTREWVGDSLNRFRVARNDADYSVHYPNPVEEDACSAVAAAEAILPICREWIETTRRLRCL